MDILSDKITQIEKIHLSGTRPRSLGCNARIGVHGENAGDAVIRIHTAGGGLGVGWARLDREMASRLVGAPVSELFSEEGSKGPGESIDLPLWDLAARSSEQPLYRLLGAGGSREVELYDGSIYIDDLEMSDTEAAELYAEQVRSGWDAGFRNFKIKIGRGARWMPTRIGLERDILVIHEIRDAAGPDAKILVDANMGGTLNSTRETLDRCADVDIYWFEEPFAEDPAINRALKEYIQEKGISTLVADGEYSPPPYFFEMVEEGLIDVVQPDFRFRGLTYWIATAKMIEPWGAKCGPHTWGSYIERFPHAHFAASIPHYALLEAAPIDMPGLVYDGWEMRDGKMIVPDTPGVGFDVDPDFIERGVKEEDGFRISSQ